MAPTGNDIIDRRQLLKGGSVAGIAFLAGCIGVEDDNADEADDEPTDDGDEAHDSGTDDADDTEDDADDADDADEDDADEDNADEDDESDEDAYEIGMVDSLTGSLADFGERNQAGVEVALDVINEVGIDGRDLEIIVEDSESGSDGGVSAAQLLVEQEGVPYLVGAVGSGVSIAIYESVVQDSDVVQVSQNSTGLGLTEYPDLLRTCPSGLAQSAALADIIADDGHDEVALTYANDDFGESLADAFVDEYDGEVVMNQSHDLEEASYSSLVSAFNDSGAEAWLFITYQQEFATMVTEVYESGYEAEFYGADSNRGDTVIENTPEGSMDGMILVEPSADPESEEFQAFAERYEEAHGESPTAWSGFAYDAVVLGALSILAADEFSGEALREVVREVTREPGEAVNSYEDAHEILANGGTAEDINYEGVSGPLDIDENGDPEGALEVFEVQGHEYESIDFIGG